MQRSRASSWSWCLATTVAVVATRKKTTESTNQLSQVVTAALTIITITTRTVTKVSGLHQISRLFCPLLLCRLQSAPASGFLRKKNCQRPFPPTPLSNRTARWLTAASGESASPQVSYPYSLGSSIRADKRWLES